MPYENCKDCMKCSPCPITQVNKNEGAYSIAKEIGNSRYCISCFYCEDICPDYSPRQFAIDKQRLAEKTSNEMINLEQLKAHGTLFPISKEITSMRTELGLPKLPKPRSKDIKIIYKALLQDKRARCIHNEELRKALPEKELTGRPVTTALFLGCLIPYRMFEYEISSRNILKKLEIIYSDLPFSCCGSIMVESYSENLWLTQAAYNLALAEDFGIKTIIALCGGCTGNLRRVNYLLQNKSEKLAEVNSYLSLIKKSYRGTVKIVHFSELLLQNEIRKKITEKLNNNNNNQLKGLKVATQVPCQVIRPRETSPNAHYKSNLLAKSLALTKIKTVHYPFETLCCGSSMLPINENIAHLIAAKRINSLQKKQVDALILGCGNCSMNYTIHQSVYSDKRLPTYFFTEIIDYALGEQNEILSKLLEKKKKSG